MNFRLFTNGILYRLVIILLIIYCSVDDLFAQEPPPRPVEVTVTGQVLSFGAFSHGATGGTVTVTAGSLRSATGDVVLLSMGYSFSPALYQLVADPGTLISILNGPAATLTRGGGGTMSMAVGDSSPASPFVISTTPPSYTELRIGGVLTVSNSTNNPPGSYSGTFDITLVQE